jgi:hypothetical protein
MSAPRPGDGEVLDFAWLYRPLAGYCVLLGVVLGGIGIGLTLLAIAGSGVGWGLIPCGVALTAFGSLWLWCGRHVWALKPRLVLGADRLQWVEGKNVVWQVPYDNVTRLALFAAGPLGRPCLGIRLQTPGQLDQARPRLPWHWRRLRGRYGFDLSFPLDLCSEPPERMLEAMLTRLHRYQDAPGEAR